MLEQMAANQRLTSDLKSEKSEQIELMKEKERLEKFL